MFMWLWYSHKIYQMLYFTTFTKKVGSCVISVQKDKINLALQSVV